VSGVPETTVAAAPVTVAFKPSFVLVKVTLEIV
jgi:hypothetical protein